MGPSGRKVIIEKLPEIIKKKKIDFVIVNGENAGDSGVGITKKLQSFKHSTKLSYKKRLLWTTSFFTKSKAKGSNAETWKPPESSLFTNSIAGEPIIIGVFGLKERPRIQILLPFSRLLVVIL